VRRKQTRRDDKNKKPQPQLKSHRKKKKKDRETRCLLAARSSPLTLASLSFTLTEIQDLTGNNLREEPKTIPRNSQQKKLIQTNHLTPRRRLRLPREEEEEEDATLNLLCVRSAVALFFVSFLTRERANSWDSNPAPGFPPGPSPTRASNGLSSFLHLPTRAVAA
jgi:hypothetical protein